MESFDKKAKEYLSFLDNEYVSAILSIVLIVYATMAAPKLPESVARIFDYTAFKLLLFFLIAYISNKNPTVAIIAAVAVLVSLMTLSKYKAGEEMMEVIKNEANVPPTSEIATAPLHPPVIPPELTGSELSPEIPMAMTSAATTPITESVVVPEKKPITPAIIPEVKTDTEQIPPEVLSEITDKPTMELSPSELSRMAARSCKNASHNCHMAAKSCGGTGNPMMRRPIRQPRGYDTIANAFAPL